MKLDRIVVAVDGSANSVVALEWAAKLAEALEAEVVAVHAMGMLDRGAGGEVIVSEPNREQIRRRFETEWCAALDVHPVRDRRLVRDGDAVSVVLALAEVEDADLIVLGSRGLGGYPELLLGSTSTQVAQRSHRPVTIVPTPSGASA